IDEGGIRRQMIGYGMYRFRFPRAGFENLAGDHVIRVELHLYSRLELHPHRLERPERLEDGIQKEIRDGEVRLDESGRVSIGRMVSTEVGSRSPGSARSKTRRSHHHYECAHRQK